MHILSSEKMLHDLPMYRQLLTLFITKELFHFNDLKEGLTVELATFDNLAQSEQELMLETMHKRITEHNIHVVAGYYARITMARLASLLMLPQTQMETQLCEMVTKKQIYARIDRPAGVISFVAPKSPSELLNDWSGDISQLLNLLEGSCHLIHKENMVHKIVS
uniref:PCI domain-containing protein n=2 Tax=Chrysotila carterae TaxID=13221 RepID=A0A7S4B3L0_CHRCT